MDGPTMPSPFQVTGFCCTVLTLLNGAIVERVCRKKNQTPFHMQCLATASVAEKVLCFEISAICWCSSSMTLVLALLPLELLHT